LFFQFWGPIFRIINARSFRLIAYSLVILCTYKHWHLLSLVLWHWHFVFPWIKLLIDCSEQNFTTWEIRDSHICILRISLLRVYRNISWRVERLSWCITLHQCTGDVPRTLREYASRNTRLRRVSLSFSVSFLLFLSLPFSRIILDLSVLSTIPSTDQVEYVAVCNWQSSNAHATTLCKLTSLTTSASETPEAVCAPRCFFSLFNWFECQHILTRAALEVGIRDVCSHMNAIVTATQIKEKMQLAR